MKKRSYRTFGVVLGYIAISIGVITLGLWFLTDAESTMTAVGALTTVMVGALVITMSNRSNASNNSWEVTTS